MIRFGKLEPIENALDKNLIQNHNFEDGSTNWISATQYSFSNDLCIVTRFPTSTYGGQNVDTIPANHTILTILRRKIPTETGRTFRIYRTSDRNDAFISLGTRGPTSEFEIISEVSNGNISASRIYFGSSGSGSEFSGELQIDWILMFDLTELKNEGIIKEETEEAFYDVFEISESGEVSGSIKKQIKSIYKGEVKDKYALEFDGSGGYVEAFNTEDLLKGKNAYTLQVFLKTEGQSEEQRTIAGYRDNDAEYRFYIHHLSDSDELEIRNRINGESYDLSPVYTNDEYGEWVLITFVRESNESRVYFNGELKDSRNDLPTDNFGSNEVNFGFGKDINDDRFYYDGKIKMGSLWNKALTEQEINDYMNTPPTGNETGLVAYYDFQDGQGTTLTDKAGDNDGTIVGADWKYIDTIGKQIKSIYKGEVKDKYALEFDGQNDYVEVPHNSNLDITQEITIQYQIYIYEHDTQRPFDKVAKTESGYELNLGQSGDFIFRFNRESDTSIRSGENQPLNEWLNVTGTYDGNTAKLYINGVLENSENFSTQIGTNNDPLIIGNDQEIDSPFDGKLKEVTLWNKALTEQEINDYMNNPPTGNEDGLVAYYDFQDGSGTTLTDKAGNNDGTIVGANWVTIGKIGEGKVIKEIRKHLEEPIDTKELSDFDLVETFSFNNEINYGSDFTPDGKYLIIGSEDNNVYVYDLENNFDLVKTIQNNGDVDALSVSKDNKYFAYSSFNNNSERVIYFVRISDFEIVKELAKPQGQAYGSDYSYDSNYVAFGSSSVILVYDTSDENPDNWFLSMSISESSEESYFPVFSPDNQYLAFSTYRDQKVKIMNINNWELEKTFSYSDRCIGLDFSKDGKYFAAGAQPVGGGGETHIYDVKDNFNVIATLTEVGRRFSAGGFRFSYDSQYIFYTEGFEANILVVAKGEQDWGNRLETFNMGSSQRNRKLETDHLGKYFVYGGNEVSYVRKLYDITQIDFQTLFKK